MFYEKIKVNTDDFSKTEGLAVSPYISDSDQRFLIGVYLEKLFDNNNYTSAYNVLNAENELLLAEIDRLTNIQMTDFVDEKEVPLFTLDDVFKNIEFINGKLKSISNYRDFMFRFASSIELAKENNRLEHSLGSALDNVYAKLLGLLNKFQELEPEAIKALVDETNKSEILKDAISIFKTQQTEKKPE